VIDVRSSLLRRLYSDWSTWRGSREFPSRRNFDPLDTTYIIGKLSLLDVRYQPLRFHYRVHATEFATRLGFDMTGKGLDQYPDAEYRAIVEEHFVSVIERRQPSVRRRERQRRDGRIWSYEVLVLPLSADGARIDMLMSATEFT
jgi:hypothetical protein